MSNKVEFFSDWSRRTSFFSSVNSVKSGLNVPIVGRAVKSTQEFYGLAVAEKVNRV